MAMRNGPQPTPPSDFTVLPASVAASRHVPPAPGRAARRTRRLRHRLRPRHTCRNHLPQGRGRLLLLVSQYRPNRAPAMIGLYFSVMAPLIVATLGWCLAVITAATGYRSTRRSQ